MLRRINQRWLLPLVFLIWAGVVWRFAESPRPELGKGSRIDSVQKTVEMDSCMRKFALLFPYRDPFHSSAPFAKTTSPIASLTKASPVDHSAHNELPIQACLGTVISPSQKVALVRLSNRKIASVMEGDRLQDAHILQILSHRLLYRYGGSVHALQIIQP